MNVNEEYGNERHYDSERIWTHIKCMQMDVNGYHHIWMHVHKCEWINTNMNDSKWDECIIIIGNESEMNIIKWITINTIRWIGLNANDVDEYELCKTLVGWAVGRQAGWLAGWQRRNNRQAASLNTNQPNKCRKNVIEH